MTHPASIVLGAQRLAAQGLNATEISRRIGVPRPTVRDWLYGKTPRPPADHCPRCDSTHAAIDELLPEYVYLLGLYLGDGCISTHPRGVYRLRITLDTAYPGIIAAAEAAIRAVLPRSTVGQVRKEGCVEVCSYSKVWPCLFPQHGPGKKHERPIVLQPWQSDLVRQHPELLLRGLIHSDGCRFINTGRKNWRCPRYSFSNRSDDIREIFCQACELLGLRWTTCPYTVYVSRRDDVAILDGFIGPKA